MISLEFISDLLVYFQIDVLDQELISLLLLGRPLQKNEAPSFQIGSG